MFIEPSVLADQLGIEPAVLPEPAATPPIGDPSDAAESVPPDTEAGLLRRPKASDLLRAFDPTKGPLVTPRQALVIDPYHAVDARWREGDEVAALFGSHPDYGVVRHLKDSVSHADLASFGEYDAVHVVSHGYTRCDRDSDGEIIADGSRCSSGFGLGVIPDGFDRSTLPRGVTVLRSSVDDNNRQFAYDSFFADQGLQQNLGETVVMLSTCQGSGLGSGFASSQGTLLDADLQTPMMGIFGSALGWDQNVTLRAGANASLAFWSLTVEEGVDAELAYQQLQQAGLDVSGERSDLVDDFVDYIQENPPNAELEYRGEDLRVRDVIETQYANSELVPQTKIKLTTTPGDGADDKIDQLQFFVEAIRDDELAGTEIKLFLDDQEIPETINVLGNSSRIGGGNGYGHYLVTVENVDLGVDIPRSAVDPSDLQDYRLEARVSSDGFTEYSAHEADPVHFGAEFIARGPLPVFTELADGMPAGGALEGNELVVSFDTTDPEVEGEFSAVMSGQGIEIGFWTYKLEGTYDVASAEMSGTISGEAFVGVAGISADESSSGTWQGRVDFGSGTVQATIGLSNGSQQYNGSF